MTKRLIEPMHIHPDMWSSVDDAHIRRAERKAKGELVEPVKCRKCRSTLIRQWAKRAKDHCLVCARRYGVSWEDDPCVTYE